MARPPIGERAMTPAERQRRRRKKLKEEQSSEIRQQLRRQRRDENAKRYMPMPPGITYWRTVEVLTADGPREIRTPTTQPLAACENRLEDAEIMSLLRQLTRQAIRRGLLKPGEPVLVETLNAGEQATAELLQAAETRELEPGEGWTIGPLP